MRTVHLLALALLLCGAGRAFGHNPIVEPACPQCGDESAATDEITVSASVSAPFSVQADNPMLSFHRSGGAGTVAGLSQSPLDRSLVDPMLHSEQSALFTIGGLEGETIIVDLVTAPVVGRRDDGSADPVSSTNPVSVDLSWSGQQLPGNEQLSSGSFPARITLGDDNGPGRPDGMGAFQMYIGGTTSAALSPSDHCQGKVTLRMYYLE